MRKYFGGLFLALAIAVLVPGTALATHSNGQGPDKDFQNGTAKTECPTPFGSVPCQVHNNGQSESAAGPGVPAQGHFYVRLDTTGLESFGVPNPVVLSGDIICLTAVNTDAWIRSVITESNTALAPPGFTLFGRATDNGEGVNDPEDESTGFLDAPGQTTCPQSPLSTTPIQQGNITIHDGI